MIIKNSGMLAKIVQGVSLATIISLTKAETFAKQTQKKLKHITFQLFEIFLDSVVTIS